MPLVAQIGGLGLVEDLGGLNDVAPVGLAGVEGEDVHLAVLRKLGEQLQIHGGKRGDAEYEIALRQARVGAGERLHQRAPQLHAVRCALFAVV